MKHVLYLGPYSFDLYRLYQIYPLNLTTSGHLPVEFGNGMSGCLAHVRGHVVDALLHSKLHDGHDHGHTNAGQHTQGTRADQLIRVLGKADRLKLGKRTRSYKVFILSKYVANMEMFELKYQNKTRL
jgi:hypothetical protein